MVRHLVSAFLLIVLFYPLTILLAYVTEASLPDFQSLFAVGFRHVSVSLVAAAFALLFGFFAALGLSEKWRSGFRSFLLLLPCLMPPLFVILATHNLWPGTLPLGFLTLALVMGLVNVGLAAVSLSHLFSTRLAGISEWALASGLSRIRFWRMAIGAVRAEVLILFSLIFTFCFFSFSYALALSGDQLLSLEVMALIRLKETGQLSDFIGLSFVQLFLFLAILTLFSRRFVPEAPERQHQLRFLTARNRWIAVLPAALVGAGLLIGAIRAGVTALPHEKWMYLIQIVQKGFPSTVVVGLVTGWLVVILSVMIFSQIHKPVWETIMHYYTLPSSLLLSVGFLLLPGLKDLPFVVKIIFVVTMANLPSVYKWLGASMVAPLRTQVQVAYVLGIPEGATFWKITLPFVLRRSFEMAALASVWAMGDFALSALVSSQDVTLAMDIRTLTQNYRIAEANILIWILLLISAVSYGFFYFGSRISVQEQDHVAR